MHVPFCLWTHPWINHIYTMRGINTFQLFRSQTTRWPNFSPSTSFSRSPAFMPSHAVIVHELYLNMLILLLLLLQNLQLLQNRLLLELSTFNLRTEIKQFPNLCCSQRKATFQKELFPFKHLFFFFFSFFKSAKHFSPSVSAGREH